MSRENRLTDRKKITAASASENLRFYVVDVDNKTEDPSGSSFQVSKPELKAILGIDILLNEKYLENPSYADIPALLADQANQTPGKVQHVIDASADITVAAGYAYYTFIGPPTNSLANYTKLTNEEAALLQNNTGLATFTVQDVLELLGETVEASAISFQHAAGNVTNILFNKVFSLYLKAYQDLISTHDIEIIIFNRTKQKTLIAKIIGISYSNGDDLYFKTSVNPGIDPNDVSTSDTVEININIQQKSSGLYKMGDYLVDKKGATVGFIKAGNMLFGIGDLVPGEFIIATANIDNPQNINDLTVHFRS